MYLYSIIPLIKHKISILRDKNTGMKEFRELVEEITQIMTYVSMEDVALVPVEVETPLEKTVQYRIPEESVAIVPILRAGLGMVNGVHKVFPTARVGHIGMYRDEETLEPQEYYCKLPDGIENKTVILVDPMLATGGSACDALAALKKRGCKNIRMMSIIAAPEGNRTGREGAPRRACVRLHARPGAERERLYPARPRRRGGQAVRNEIRDRSRKQTGRGECAPRQSCRGGCRFSPDRIVSRGAGVAAAPLCWRLPFLPPLP